MPKTKPDPKMLITELGPAVAEIEIADEHGIWQGRKERVHGTLYRETIVNAVGTSISLVLVPEEPFTYSKAPRAEKYLRIPVWKSILIEWPDGVEL